MEIPQAELKKLADGLAPVDQQDFEASEWRPQWRGIKEIELDKRCDRYVIKQLFSLGDTVALYGPSGSGKTFLMLHMVKTIACGGEWCGRKVQPKKVWYLSLEGHEGFKKRLLGYDTNDELSASHNFGFDCITGTDLQMKETQRDLIETIKEQGIKVLVIDTLARLMSGHDENSAQGMSVAIDFCNRINKETGATVILVHHTGKDADRGARGHSSFRAALDCEIEVSTDDGDRYVRMTKVKDGKEGERFSFFLQEIELGVDDEGDRITTCLVDGFEKTERTAQKEATGANSYLYKLIQQVINDQGQEQKPAGDMSPVRMITRAQLWPHLVEWEEYGDVILKANKAPEEDKHNARLSTALKRLRDKNLINYNRKGIWLA